MELSERFKGRCENISAEWREQLKLHIFDPLPAEKLVIEFAAILFSPDALTSAPMAQVSHLLNSDNWSAGIIRLSPLWILYNPRHSSKRFEADMMHEFAHVILRHPKIGLDPVTGLPIRQQQYEDEATFLGSCLQIPKRGLAWAVQKRMTMEQISDYFMASNELVGFRLNMTSIRLG